MVDLSQIYGSQLDTLNDQGDSEAPPPPVRMAIILKSLQRAHAEQSVGEREPFRTVGRNANWCSHCGKQYGHPLKNLKLELSYGPAILFLGVYQEKTLHSKSHLHPSVHCSTIYESQEVEAT